MPAITLYRVNGACSIVPHSLLQHFGLPFAAVQLKTGSDGYEAADGSLSHAQFLSINPTGYVPAIVTDDGAVITEMPAVLTYIACMVPEQDLLGQPGLERAKVAEWMAWLSGTLHASGFGAFWRPYRYAHDTSAHAAISAQGRETIDGCYARIEERLKGRDWAVGEGLTVVDFNLYVFCRWGGLHLRIDMAHKYPSYGSLMRKIERLEGVRKAVELEQQPFYFE